MLIHIGIELPKIRQFILPNSGYYTNCSLKFDSISGYRISNSFRILKTANGELLYDQSITPNKQGYHSKVDFLATKTNKRFIVFGDSQTGSIYLDSTWVDRVNTKSIPKDSIEYYSFAQDGAGIGNWHSIFFNEILPQYEFDGIVIAVFGNDLDRSPFVIHQDSKYTYIGNLDSLNVSATTFMQKHIAAFYKEANIITNQQADSLVKSIETPKNQFGLNLKKYFFENLDNAFYNYYMNKRLGEFVTSYIWDNKNPKKVLTVDYFKIKYGENFIRLSDIVHHCKANKKKVIFCILPEQYGTLLNKEGKKTIIQDEIAYLSSYFDASFFDGYAALAKYDDTDIKSCFLPYDGHFNTKGASFFAREFISDMNIFNSTLNNSHKHE
jgi:hypothetical protein